MLAIVLTQFSRREFRRRQRSRGRSIENAKRTLQVLQTADVVPPKESFCAIMNAGKESELVQDNRAPSMPLVPQPVATLPAILQPVVARKARKSVSHTVSPVLPAASISLHVPDTPILPPPSITLRSPEPVVVQPQPSRRNKLARPTASLAELLRVAQSTRLNAVAPVIDDTPVGNGSQHNTNSTRATPPSVPTQPHAESDIAELLHFAQSTRLGSHSRSNRVMPLPPLALAAALATSKR